MGGSDAGRSGPPAFDFAALPSDVQQEVARALDHISDVASLELSGRGCRAAVRESGIWQALAGRALGQAAAAELRPDLSPKTAKTLLRTLPRQERLSQMCWVARGDYLVGPGRGAQTHMRRGFFIDVVPVTAEMATRALERASSRASRRRVGMTSLLGLLGYRKCIPDSTSASASAGAPHEVAALSAGSALATAAAAQAARPRSAGVPFTNVTWGEASLLAGAMGLRLPRAIERECAARGHDGRRYPWGDEWIDGAANTAEAGLGHAAPTQAFPRDTAPCGAMGLAGNVFEWTADAAHAGRHAGSQPGDERVNAGLSFNRRGSGGWGTWRTESDPPAMRMTDVGFRCAFSPLEEAMRQP